MGCIKSFHVVCKDSSLISPLLKEIKTCISHDEYLTNKGYFVLGLLLVVLLQKWCVIGAVSTKDEKSDV